MADIHLQGNADYAQVARDIADDLAVLGMICTAPTTGSTQAAGVGNTDWNIDITAGEVLIDGCHTQFAAQADYDVHSGSLLVSAGQSVYARLVAKLVGTVVSLVVVVGTPAVHQSEVEPTDDEVQTAVGANVLWADIALLHLRRGVGVALTQWQKNHERTKTRKV